MEFLFGLAVGAVAGGAVVYIYHAWVKNKFDPDGPA